MRLTFQQQPRPWTLLSAFRPLVAVCFAALLLAHPAAAETNKHATSPDLDLSMPKGLDAQPQPVYPDDRFGSTDTSATDADSDEADADEPARSASRSPAEEPESSLTSDPDIETLKSDDLADVEAPVEPKTPIIVATVDKTAQEMTVFVDGVEEYRWPVSTGLPGYATPGGTFTASSMNEIWYSKQFDNAPMPHAVFFTKKGHAIHATKEVKKLGRPASHGCVRLSPKNAETFFNLVKETGLDRTEVVLTGATPGGDYKIAHPDRRYDPYQDYGRPVYPRYAPNRNYQRYGYNEIEPRAERRRRVFVPRNQQRQYRRAPRRGNWFRAPGY
ncbi:L,D-transpeptidase [Methyloceanibacter sp. wino2]|uniref:L,D-transpeptidase n=1 Tax=Methyloceanibacter sp. wino2 TaxID=2170729 RepID=UPI00352F5D4B